MSISRDRLAKVFSMVAASELSCLCFASLSSGVAKLLKAYVHDKKNGKVLAASCCEFIVCWMPTNLDVILPEERRMFGRADLPE